MPKKDCGTCGGSGTVTQHRPGQGKIIVVCPACKGSGRK